MSAERSSEPAPWCLFGFFLGIQKEARRRGGETPLRYHIQIHPPAAQEATGFSQGGIYIYDRPIQDPQFFHHRPH